MNRLLLLLGTSSVLSACMKREPPPTAVDSTLTNADQILDSMSFSITQAGVLLSEVEADTAEVYGGIRHEMELRHMTMVFFDSTGREKSRITADSGLYKMGIGTLDAWGSVVVVTPPPDNNTLRTSHLLYDKSTNMIEVDTAYTWTTPDGTGTGASMTSTTDFKSIRQVQPRAVQSGAGIDLTPPEEQQ
jgi:LPS export ABC transporter protein LptC